MSFRTLVPRPIRDRLHPISRRIRRPALERTLRDIRQRGPQELPTIHQARQLCVKWATGATVSEDVLIEVARLCRDADGPVLECGSGATTFIAAIYAKHGCWSLENDAPYRDLVVDTMNRAGLASHVVYAPLQPHEGFVWYDTSDAGLPERFAAVICDGPAGAALGGRFGLLPCMHESIAGAEVLLDDADREGEQAVLRRWEELYGVSQITRAGRAALLRVPVLGA